MSNNVIFVTLIASVAIILGTLLFGPCFGLCTNMQFSCQQGMQNCIPAPAKLHVDK